MEAQPSYKGYVMVMIQQDTLGHQESLLPNSYHLILKHFDREA